eukprot:scaffold2911_cov414-Prasinococcus_capsulatus_cf.AAC.62
MGSARRAVSRCDERAPPRAQRRGKSGRPEGSAWQRQRCAGAASAPSVRAAELGRAGCPRVHEQAHQGLQAKLSESSQARTTRECTARGAGSRAPTRHNGSLKAAAIASAKEDYTLRAP